MDGFLEFEGLGDWGSLQRKSEGPGSNYDRNSEGMGIFQRGETSVKAQAN